MARNSKDRSLRTRDVIVDAAIEVFDQVGVSQSSLNQIAAKAGVTRGAIYVHFKNKLDLFEFLCEQVILPYEYVASERSSGSSLEGVALVKERWRVFLQLVTENERIRKILSIIYLRCEWVSENTRILERILDARNQAQRTIAEALESEKSLGRFRVEPGSEIVATLLHTAMTGLLHAWLISPQQFALLETGTHQLDMMLDGLVGA